MLKNPRNSTYLYKHLVNKERLLGQKYNKFFILDFEATCDKHATLEPQEIIEFPCIEVNARNLQVTSVFQRFVKPVINPMLTPFCTDLTGISQDAIKDEPEFPVVLNSFLEWLKPKYINENESIIVTCGTWDIKTMLPKQCELCNLQIPAEFHKFINLKTAFYQSKGYYPRSLKDMCKRLALPIKGTLHRGIDDCFNIHNIMKHLAENNYIFEETDKYTTAKDTNSETKERKT